IGGGKVARQAAKPATSDFRRFIGNFVDQAEALRILGQVKFRAQQEAIQMPLRQALAHDRQSPRGKYRSDRQFIETNSISGISSGYAIVTAKSQHATAGDGMAVH